MENKNDKKTCILKKKIRLLKSVRMISVLRWWPWNRSTQILLSEKCVQKQNEIRLKENFYGLGIWSYGVRFFYRVLWIFFQRFSKTNFERPEYTDLKKNTQKLLDTNKIENIWTTCIRPVRIERLPETRKLKCTK